MAWTLIRGGTVVDGTGSPPFQADVCIRDGVIDAVGPDLSAPEGAQVMDAAGKLITPGFINMHSHSDCSAAMYPNMESTLGQGITTEFAGHCGLGVAPVQHSWLYMFPEKKAFTKVMPEPPGGTHTTPISFPLSGCGSPLPRPTVRSWTGLLMASSWSICAEWGWAPTWLWWPGRPRSAYRPWAPTTIGTPLRRRSPPWRAPSARPWMAARWD